MDQRGEREEDRYQPTADEKPEECGACSYPTTELTFYQSPEHRLSNSVWLCRICRGTSAGNAATYPHSYGEDPEVLFAISYVGNLLLDEIRRRLPLPEQQDPQA